MNILFLVSSYKPWLNSNTSCIANIIDNKPEGINIHVVANRHFCSSQNVESSFELTWIGRAKSKVINFVEVMCTVVSRGSFNKRLCNDYYEYLVEHGSSYDVVVPVCFPFETLVASVKYKCKSRSGPAVVPVWYDEYAESDSAHRLTFLRKVKSSYHLDLEKEAIQNSELVFCTTGMAEKLLGKGIENDKIVQLEHPLVKQVKNRIPARDTTTTKFIYAGNLSGAVRDGRFAFSLFTCLSKKNYDFIFESYLFGSAYKQYLPFQNKHIQVKRPVSKDEVEEELWASNILVVIGNNKSEQEQGKVYEFISLGKPIIYFYKTASEPIYSVLEMYPLCFFVDEKKGVSQALAESLWDFVKLNKFQNISYHCIEKQYYAYSALGVSEKFFKTLKAIF